MSNVSGALRGPRGRKVLPIGVHWLFVSILFLLCTWLAMRQAPEPDPYQPTPFSQAWRQPIEQNAFLRLARISGDLTDIAVIGSHVWAVGQDGLIVASDDGGKSWRQQSWLGQTGPAGLVTAGLDQTNSDVLGSVLANWHFWPQAVAASAPPPPVTRQPVREQLSVKQLDANQVKLKQVSAKQLKDAELREKERLREVIEPPRGKDINVKNARQNIINNSAAQTPVFEQTVEARQLTDQSARSTSISPPSISAQSISPPSTRSISAQTKIAEPVLSEPPELPDLKSVFFLNSTVGWSVGDGGTVLRTVDGGRTWERTLLSYFHDGRAHREIVVPGNVPSLNLHKVFFIDEQRGWIVGAAGLVLRTEDGGQQWRLARQDIDAPLYDVWFADARQGWAVGDDGVLLQSGDGGNSWRRQSGITNLRLRALHFSSTDLGWAVGDQGQMLETQDGGRTWQGRTDVSTSHLRKIIFQNGREGWLLPHRDRTIIRTSDGGRNWQNIPIPTHANINSLTVSDEGSLWLVGASGTVLRLTPSGQWMPMTQGAKGDYRQVQFHTANVGWLLAGDNMLYRTINGGQDWQPHALPGEHRLWAIDFSTAQKGVAVGSAGARWQTSDGGRTWQQLGHAEGSSLFGFEQETGAGERLDEFAGKGANNAFQTVFRADTQAQQIQQVQMTQQVQQGRRDPVLLKADMVADKIWMVGRSDRIFWSEDSGLSWSNNIVQSNRWFSTLNFINAQQGWVGGAQGVLAKTEDGGKTWQAQQSTLKSMITDIDFVDPQRGWAVTRQGEILNSENGGAQWQVTRLAKSLTFTALNMLGPNSGWAVTEEGVIVKYDARQWRVLSQVAAPLNDVAFQSQNQGWVVGAGALLNSTDGGRTWQVPEYTRSPGLWYWLVCAVLVFYVVYQVRRHRVVDQVAQSSASVADVLASDRPLQPGDPDPLNFGQIARGLSRFMRNPATEPPLTVAVTGEWGSGKSSLMNLLYHDLKGYGFTPVWFNAWHHQKGEQLLASLYANIRAQAVPGWLNWYGLRPIGLLFRLRLLYRRSARRWLLFLIATTLLVGTVTYLLSHPEQIDWSQWRYLLDVDNSANILDKIFIGLLGLSPPIAALLANLRAFGLSPEKLMAISGASADKQAQMDPNARQRFAQEFRDVSDSLELGRMVIFIDDLDRCRKENVVEILEAINFLSVSGQCYIVVGMAEAWVKTCVALAFHDLAEHTHFNDYYREEAAPDDPQARLIEFAEQYLEKLINIRVPVPRLSQADTQNLLPIHPPEADTAPLMARMVRGLVARMVRYQHLLIWLSLMCVGVVAGLNWPTLVALEQTIDPEIEWQWSDLEIQSLRWRNGAPEIQLGPASASVSPKEASGDAVLSLPGQAAASGVQQSIQKTNGQGASALDGHWDLVVQTSEAQAKRGIVLGELGKEGERASVVLRLKEQSGVAGDRKGQNSPETSSGRAPEAGTTELALIDEDVLLRDPQGPSTQIGVEVGRASPFWQDWFLPILTFSVCCILFLVPALRRMDRITTDSAEFREALAIWQPWIVARRLTPRAIKRYLNRVRYIAMRYRPEDPPQTWRQRFWNWASPSAATTAATHSAEEGPQLHESVVVALSAIQVLDEDWVLDDAAFDKIVSGHLDELLQEKFPELALTAQNQGEGEVPSARLQTVLSQLGAAIERHQTTFNDGLLGDVDQRRQFCDLLARGGQG